jgi:hypothetical protein
MPITSSLARRAASAVATSRARRTLAAVMLVAVTGATGLATQATATPGTISVHGTFANLNYSGPSCTAPVGLCFKGKFMGSIHGPDSGAVNSLAPTQQPDVVQGDASTTIHTKRGDLTCAHEQFVLNTSPSADGHFAWLCEITSGTGRYAGATGYLQGVGTNPDPTTPNSGTYSGRITLP